LALPPVAVIGNYVYDYVMSPKARFQVMLEPEAIEWLRLIQRNTGATLGEQIRRAVSLWIESELGIDRQVIEMPLDDRRVAVLKKPARKRAGAHKRSESGTRR
jgi:hypothetical protein